MSEVFICIIGTPMCAKRSSARRCDGLGSCLGELHNLHHRHADVCGAFIGSLMRLADATSMLLRLLRSF